MSVIYFRASDEIAWWVKESAEAQGVSVSKWLERLLRDLRKSEDNSKNPEDNGELS